MSRSIRKSLSMILVIFVFFVSCLSVSVNAEKPEDYDDDGKMNLDVVFVLDASNSMLSSDPNRVAIDAFNLFTDLCDETCGVGYTVYTEKLKASSEIVSLDNKKNLEKLKKDISDIEYDPYGSTDIALGLTKGMNIHSQNQNTDNNRKKAIILLSDGNTYLENGPRTLAEANKEMNSTLKTLNSRNIPVYSIGLNYDGTLDKKELQKISKETNGKSYETTTSDDLITIISDIFSDIYKLNGTNCEIKDGNVKIKVKDNSVFYVNVIIKSKFSKAELNPVLTSPDGKKVSLTNNDNIKLTGTDSYTLIKMIYPESGTWNLHLDKANSDNCTITQLDFYSIYVKQKINKTAAIGESVIIEASLNDIQGLVKDDDLLKTIEMTTIISGNNEEKTISLTRKSNGVYTGEFTPDSEGEYTVKTKAISKTFEKESTATKINVKLKVASVTSEPSNTEVTDNSGFYSTLLIIISAVIISFLLMIIIFTVIRVLKRRQTEYLDEPPATPQPPKPQPQPIKSVTPSPKPKDPEYVDIQLIEHDALENLIKKGPDNAFNKNADNYKADTTLESLIKKGPEDAFNTKASDYKTDENLEKLIKKGSDDPFNAKLDECKTDENLEKLIRKGADDPFNTKLDEYKVDPKLEKLIKSGESGLEEKPKTNVNLNKTAPSANKIDLSKSEQTADRVNLEKNTKNNP
ncbi:MAG: VWA domain-containing protein [Acutalibacteraceae bacterium]